MFSLLNSLLEHYFLGILTPIKMFVWFMLMFFLIITSHYCQGLGVGVQQFPAAWHEKGILFLIENDTVKCETKLDRSYFKSCNRPFEPLPGLQEDEYFDFGFSFCVALYDASLLVCNSSDPSIKNQAQNRTLLLSDLKQDEQYSSKLICDNIRSSLDKSSFAKFDSKDQNHHLKDWVALFKKKISENKTCEQECLQGKKVNPVCSVILWIHKVLADTQTQINDEGERPSGYGNDDPQNHGNGEEFSYTNYDNGSTAPYRLQNVPGESSTNHVRNNFIAPNSENQQYYNSMPVEDKAANSKSYAANEQSNDKTIDTAETHEIAGHDEPNKENMLKVKNDANKPTEMDPDGSSSIKMIPEANAAIKTQSSEKKLNKNVPEADVSKSHGNIEPKLSETNTSSDSTITQNTDNRTPSEKEQLSDVDKTKVKNDTKSNITSLGGEPLKSNNDSSNKNATVSNNSSSVLNSNPKSSVVKNTSVNSTSLNNETLSSGGNTSAKVTDTPVEKTGVKPQTSAPVPKTEITGKEVAEQEETQIDSGANPMDYGGEDEDSDGGIGDTGTGGGGEDDIDDAKMDAESEVKQETTANENVIVNNRFVNAEDSHFFAYFMTMAVLCIIGYLIFHNKQKILALALEGRSRRGSRRRPNTAGYRKLDSNLEEAVTSSCSSSVTHVIY